MPTGSFEAFDVAVRRRRHGPIAAIDLLAGLRRVVRASHVRADARGVFLDGEHTIVRDDVRRAYALPTDGGAHVIVFETPSQTLEIHLSDAAKSDAILEATRLAVNDATVRFENVDVDDGSTRQLVTLGGVVAVCAIVAVGLAMRDVPATLSLPLVLGAGVLAMLHATRANEITIGADGVSYRVGARERFHAHAALVIESGDASTMTACLRIGAHRLLLRFASRRACATFVARLTAAIENARRPRAAHDTATRLARGARPDEQWLRDLRALRHDAPTSYRASSIPVDDLWQVVEDPAAPSSARAGAALGLHPTLDDSGRARLRVAADACASPRLRVALDAAASESDDDAIERAVEKCADEASPQRG